MEARKASTEVVRIVRRKQNRIIIIWLFLFESYTIKVSVTGDDDDDDGNDVIGVSAAFLLWYFTAADVVGKSFVEERDTYVSCVSVTKGFKH